MNENAHKLEDRQYGDPADERQEESSDESPAMNPEKPAEKDAGGQPEEPHDTVPAGQAVTEAGAALEAEADPDELALREKVGDSERVLEQLEEELREVDAELEALAEQKPRYELLADVCLSLEQLDRVGGSPLLWGEQAGKGELEQRLAHARRGIDGFSDEIARVSERRRAIVGRIGAQNNVLDCLHYDLRDAIERDESRRNEWLVEREPDELPRRRQVMPWARGTEEDRRLNYSLAASVLLCALLGWIVSVIDLPILERKVLLEVPERVAKLVREERKPPPPEPVVEPPVEQDPPEPEPELAEEIPEEPLPEAVQQPAVAEAETPDVKEQVRTKGILAFRESFASRARLDTSAELGSQARITNAGADAVGRPERSMVTTSAPGSSGGINLADLSRDVGGGGGPLEGVQVTRVASSIGAGEGADRPLASGALAGRTDEEIQIVFDRYKAALYRLYNRELRRDPTLRGQLILRLTIEPDGSVSFCQLHSSDMDAPALAEQVVDRVRGFDFGAKEGIVAMTIIYPIDFLPAA